MYTRSFHIVTFGCQVNVNDSLWLSRSLKKRGFIEVPIEQATVIIITTCSVRDKPEQKVYNLLGRIQHITKNSENIFVVVAGCVAQQVGDLFFKKFKQVRIVSGSDGIALTPDAIERLFETPKLKLNLTAFTEEYVEREVSFFDGNIKNGSVAGYVNIMQGCDNHCAYCIVPYTRGKQKSRGVSAIIDECKLLLDQGVKEITFLGQNVNSYGHDLVGKGKNTFSSLVREVAALPGLDRLRFMSPHPKDFLEDSIVLFRDLPVLAPRLHLPLQSGSNTVLRRMRRMYSVEQYIKIIEDVKKMCPEIAFSTDIIVGFPGETEKDFLETLAVMKHIGFMGSFSFCYSDRPGTPSERYDSKIDTKEKLRRLEELQSVQAVYTRKWLESKVGVVTSVLIEDSREGNNTDTVYIQGRDQWGSVVNFTSGAENLAPGDIVSVKILEAKKHSLRGEHIPFDAHTV